MWKNVILRITLFANRRIGIMEFETGHSDSVHDLQLDYYGRRLATASSDRTIRIFDVASETHRLLTQLVGHDAAVWQVSWAHPKFGTLLASASFDNTVIIWKETESGWMQVRFIFKASSQHPCSDSSKFSNLAFCFSQWSLLGDSWIGSLISICLSRRVCRSHRMSCRW